MLLAHGAVIARRAGLYDVSEQALDALRQITSDAPLVTRVEAAVRERVGDEAVSFACAPEAERDETGCLYARAARGDHAGALAELDRLRRLRRAPDALRQEEIALRLSLHDLAGALATYDALPAAERRMLETLGYAAGRADMPAARERLGRDRREARDSPFAMAPLVRALGLEPDPAPALEAEGRALVGADGRGAFMPGAATAVLRHLERYRIERDGFVHWLVYDLRRVGGTSDVASGGGAYGPAIEGKSAQRLLRLHVHKRDGRVLDPDPANGSSQASELSQLEQGDYVEQIVEGYALPTDRGQLVIDTPDLLPERTSIHEARVELRRPESLPLALWSHPLLGAPSEHIADGFRESVWQLADAPPRRIEAGVAAAERTVSLSLGTLRWEHVARAMAEQLRALGDHDPVVARFAREAAGPDTGASHGLVERLVTAVGKRVRVAAGGELSDTSALYDSGAQRVTARTILELGQGSRSWLVLRALGELGVGADLAVAETEPQDTPDYPPHVGRFRHPLVVVHLADGDLWIDADVDGPPLPPGRVSPELRGRTALLADGRMVTVEAAAADAVDEADMRLVLDRSGDATGTFVVTLRGRTAQSLADQLEVTVGTDRRELLRAIVTSFWPRVDVEDVSLGSAESSWEVVLQAKVAIAGLARPDGKSGKLWVVPGLEPAHFGYGGGRRTLGASYASQSGRESALSIDTPQLYAIRRRVELPPGAVAVRLPEVVDVRGAHLTAARTARLDGAVLEDEWTLALPTGTVASDAYPAFVEDVRAVDGGFMAGARIRTP